MADDEIAIDLSKIKDFFKGKKDKKPKDDEIAIDLGQIGDFFSNLKFQKYHILLLILIPMLAGVFLRAQPAYLPITDEWAESSVHGFYRNNILQEINRNYPNLPDSRKQAMVEENFQELLKQQGGQIEQQVQQTSNQFKERMQDDNGQTYLLALDPYFWLRYAENIDENGHPGDTLVDGRPYSTLFLAPVGRFVGQDIFHPYFEYYFYKLLSIFDGDMYLMKAAFYVPIILAALCVIPAFFIAKKISGNIGGFFAAMLVAIHPSFLTRTAGGFADTDAYNVLFPLMIAWLFMEAFDARKKKFTMLLSAGAGLLVGIYSFTWGGWWYILDFLLAVAGLYTVYYLVIHRNDLKNRNTLTKIKDVLILIAVFFVSSAIFTTAFSSFGNFKSIVRSPISFTQIKDVGTKSIWPNVYTTVAEQNEISIRGAINQIGGTLMFLLSVIGIGLTLRKKDKHGNIDPKYSILLAVWFGATLYASTKGVRWVLLLVPAYAIAFGVFAGIAVKYIGKQMSKELKISEMISRASLVLIIGLLLISPFNGALNTAKREIPSMNDAWVNTLTKIKDNSTEDAIISSWWDFGHWFKYWADRGVTFDGTSQTGDRAHFIGLTLLTDDEEQAVSLLRMLNCGGNNAFETLDEENQDPLESVQVIKHIIMLEQDDARDYLTDYVSEETADEVIQYTHCDAPRDYFIASEDMVGKSGVWAHFGSWNFTRASMVFDVRQKSRTEGVQILQEKYGLSAQDAETYYYEIRTQDPNNWIAPWPSYFSQTAACSRTNETVRCNNGLILNLTSEEAYVETPQGRQYPKEISFVKNDTFRHKVFEENIWVGQNNQEIGAAFFPAGDSYQSIIMAPELTASMFTRQFFFKGEHLEYFEPFHHETDLTGLDIYVYKVDWE